MNGVAISYGSKPFRVPPPADNASGIPQPPSGDVTGQPAGRQPVPTSQQSVRTGFIYKLTPFQAPSIDTRQAGGGKQIWSIAGQLQACWKAVLEPPTPGRDACSSRSAGLLPPLRRGLVGCRHFPVAPSMGPLHQRTGRRQACFSPPAPGPPEDAGSLITTGTPALRLTRCITILELTRPSWPQAPAHRPHLQPRTTAQSLTSSQFCPTPCQAWGGTSRLGMNLPVHQLTHRPWAGRSGFVNRTPQPWPRISPFRNL